MGNCAGEDKWVSPVICWAEEGVGGGGAAAGREGQDPLEGDARVWTLPLEEPRRAEGVCRVPVASPPLPGCLLLRSLPVSLSESDAQTLSPSLSASHFLWVSLGSGPLREMSVRDKDPRKNPGRVGRRRGQGHKDS